MHLRISCTAIVWAAAQVGCSADPGRPDAPVATVVAPATSTTPETSSSTGSAVASTGVPETPPAPKSPGTAYTDLVDSPGDPALLPGALALKSGDAAGAKKLLTDVLPAVDTSATPDVSLAARVLVARACQSLKDAKCAESMHAAVIERYKDPEAIVRAISAVETVEVDRDRRIARALNAVGESLYYQAEQKRLAAEALKMPRFVGKSTKEAILKHVSTKVADWVKKRRAAIEEAEGAYLRIAMQEPLPPPRWVVDAASRVGTLWSSFVAEFRAAPIPDEWNQTGPHPLVPGSTWEQIRAAYLAALDEASAPQMERARAAFLQCQSMSKRYAYSDALTEACDDWIARHPAPPTP